MKPTVDKLIDQMQMLFKDLVARDLMAPNVISISPDRTMEQAKELMRLKKISGLPVVENDILVGLVSIEDIIKALERHTIHDPIFKTMSKNLIVVNPDENLPQIFDKFTRTGFGRFPVVDNEKRLVGIITKEDILRGILEEFRLLYVRDKRRQDVIDGEALNRSLISGEEINKLGADFAFSIDYVDISLSGIGAARLKEFLQGKGIEEEIAR